MLKDNTEATCTHREALTTNMSSNPLIDRKKAAYFAGFFDSDGLVHIEKQIKPEYPQGLYYGCAVKIEVTVEHKKQILRDIQEIFGGVLKVTRGDSLLLYFGVNEAEVFLKTLYPFLILKKPQTALWFKFREVLKQKIKNGHRLDLMKKLAEKITLLHNSDKGPSGKVRPDWTQDETNSYAAGLIDGDGSIHAKSSKSVVAQITGKPRALPEWMLNVYGGKLSQFTDSRPTANKYWKWYLSRPRATKFLISILPQSQKGLKIESELISNNKSLSVMIGI